jgi:hypothetical protein
MPRDARPAPSARAPSPFESLIEDTSQPADPAPQQQDSKVAKSDEKEAPAKSKDCKAAEPNDDAKPANTDDAAADETPVDGGSTKIYGKKIAKPEAAADVGDSIQPKADVEPPAGQQKDDVNTTPSTDGVVTVKSSDTISIDVTPDDAKQVEQPLQQLAVVADAIPNKIRAPSEDLAKTVSGKKAEDGKGKQVDGADQIETDQPTTEIDDTFQILTKDAAPQRTEDKPQTELGDGGKQHVSQGRGDFMTTSHRSDAAVPARLAPMLALRRRHRTTFRRNFRFQAPPLTHRGMPRRRLLLSRKPGRSRRPFHCPASPSKSPARHLQARTASKSGSTRPSLDALRCGLTSIATAT